LSDAGSVAVAGIVDVDSETAVRTCPSTVSVRVTRITVGLGVVNGVVVLGIIELVDEVDSSIIVLEDDEVSDVEVEVELMLEDVLLGGSVVVVLGVLLLVVGGSVVVGGSEVDVGGSVVTVGVVEVVVTDGTSVSVIGLTPITSSCACRPTSPFKVSSNHEACANADRARNANKVLCCLDNIATRYVMYLLDCEKKGNKRSLS
jgi:hypothetical protein